MRTGYTHEQKGLFANRVIHSDLHHFMEPESERTPIALCTESGLLSHDTRALKKRLERN
ncbi:hypothetical protein ACM26V_23735 [Salipaludibacillus sp. HK11]|uniref:hypothetical protein n=1 Tax=Salipaludibacillus sp. HK11 TaxID=3394320 RepID=UPI0039FCEE90